MQTSAPTYEKPNKAFSAPQTHYSHYTHTWTQLILSTATSYVYDRLLVRVYCTNYIFTCIYIYMNTYECACKYAHILYLIHLYTVHILTQ